MQGEFELESVVVKRHGVLGVSGERPPLAERAGEPGVVIAGGDDRPRLVTHGPVDGVVPGIAREMVLGPGEPEPGPAGASRPRRHHERAPMRPPRVVGRSAQ